jgi:hypothetical protein
VTAIHVERYCIQSRVDRFRVRTSILTLDYCSLVLPQLQAFHTGCIEKSLELGKFSILLQSWANDCMEGLQFYAGGPSGPWVDFKTHAEISFDVEAKEALVVIDAEGMKILNKGGHLQFIDYFR